MTPWNLFYIEVVIKVYKVSADNNYMIGYTANGVAFLFDIGDYEVVKRYRWHLSKRGYITTKIHRRNVPLHQLLIESEKGFDIDHISRNKLDNRRSNFRVCTHQQNSFNQKIRNTNTTGFMGVSLMKRTGMYEAYIHHNRKKHYLGLYSTALEAAKTRDNAAMRLFGEYANLNFKAVSLEMGYSV